jgi:hypothetical protein
MWVKLSPAGLEMSLLIDQKGAVNLKWKAIGLSIHKEGFHVQPLEIDRMLPVLVSHPTSPVRIGNGHSLNRFATLTLMENRLRMRIRTPIESTITDWQSVWRANHFILPALDPEAPRTIAADTRGQIYDYYHQSSSVDNLHMKSTQMLSLHRQHRHKVHLPSSALSIAL